MSRAIHWIWRLGRRLNGGIICAEKWPLALVVLLYFLSRVAGGSLPTFLFRTFLLLVLASYFWVRMMNKNLSCIFSAEKREITRGTPLRLSLRFENEGLLPIPKLTAFSRVPGSGQDWHILSSVPAFKSRILSQQRSLPEHGFYPLGPVHYTVSDPFGWFESRGTLYGDRYITVYPQVLPVTGDAFPLRQPFGTFRTRIRSFSDPSSIADIRPMKAGDNPKHIHWPTTARMGKPYVREFELTASGDITLVLDLSQVDAYESIAARETAFDLTAGLAASTLQNDLAVSLIARGGARDLSVRSGTGALQFREIMRALAQSKTDCRVPIERVLGRIRHHVSAGNTLLVVTGTSSPKLIALLTSLVQSGLGVALFLCLDHNRGVSRLKYAQNISFPLWVVTPDDSGLTLGPAGNRRQFDPLTTAKGAVMDAD